MHNSSGRSWKDDPNAIKKKKFNTSAGVHTMKRRIKYTQGVDNKEWFSPSRCLQFKRPIYREI